MALKGDWPNSGRIGLSMVPSHDGHVSSVYSTVPLNTVPVVGKQQCQRSVSFLLVSFSGSAESHFGLWSNSAGLMLFQCVIFLKGTSSS